MRVWQRKLIVVFVTSAVMLLGGLSALAADDATTGPPTDGTTDATSVPPTYGDGTQPVEGEIRISAISFERQVAETKVIYYFTYTGPGTIDFEYDDPNGCLVSFTDVVGEVTKHCAL